MDISGISGLNTAAAMTNTTTGLQRQVATQVTAMGLDQMKDQQEGLRKMMEQSVNPSVGSNIDYSA